MKIEAITIGNGGAKAINNMKRWSAEDSVPGSNPNLTAPNNCAYQKPISTSAGFKSVENRFADSHLNLRGRLPQVSIPYAIGFGRG